MAVRIRVNGDTDIAKNLIPTGRKLLTALVESMRFNNLKQDQRTMKMADGTVFKVKRVFGEDIIEITVPIIEEVEKQAEEVVSIPSKYKIKITNIKDGEIVDTSCLMRMAVYSKDANNLENEDHIFFDYKVPTDLDENGNLITEPEEYFGSEDNPGLEWDDDNECFVIDSKYIMNPMLQALSYQEALGTGELKHFLVYSCKSCALDIYKKARQDQQYPEIVDDDERWNEDDLAELSYNEEEILEDNMACSVADYMVAWLGVWRVIWCAVTSGYAQGIINDDGDEILDEDWPVHRDDINDWGALTSSVGVASSFGTELSPYLTFSKSPDYSYTCEGREEYFEQNTTYIPIIEEGLKDWWQSNFVHCMDDWPWLAFSSSSFLESLNGYHSYYTFKSISDEVNSYTVYIYMLRETNNWHETHTDNNPADSHSNEKYYNFCTMVTPWGNLLDHMWYRNIEEYSTKVAGTMNECEGFHWYENEDYDEDDKMLTYHYKSSNIIFFISTITYFIDKYGVIILSND